MADSSNKGQVHLTQTLIKTCLKHCLTRKTKHFQTPGFKLGHAAISRDSSGGEPQYAIPYRCPTVLQLTGQALLPMENLHSHLQDVPLVLEASQDQDSRDDKAY